MAESKGGKDPIDVGRLKSLYSSPPPSGLNIALRNDLEAFAASTKSNFAQDNVGNIYISRPGSDPSLSGIALTFPLDSLAFLHDSFSGALHTFIKLLRAHTKCEVSLLGWSSPGQSRVGQDVWEEEMSIDAAYEEFPALRTFNGLDDVSVFGYSALLEITEMEGAALEVRGSPLLGEKARSYVPANGTVGGGGPTSSRCPVLSICGEGAAEVGERVAMEYSEYVAKLFENFD